jgi:hypothetical protein
VLLSNKLYYITSVNKQEEDEMSKFAQAGDFCPNKACADYGKQQSEHQQNIIRFGKTTAGRQRFKCKTCGRTFTETKGTIFYRRRTPEDEIIETLAFVAEGSRISSLVRVKGHKEDTIVESTHILTAPHPVASCAGSIHTLKALAFCAVRGVI